MKKLLLLVLCQWHNWHKKPYKAVHCVTSLLILQKQSTLTINPLNPHDASKHQFAYLKNDLISYIYVFRIKMFLELF